MSDNSVIDVDAMSDEELDSFLEEQTGVDMNESTDVVDEPEGSEESNLPEVSSEETDQPEANEEEEATEEESISDEESGESTEGTEADDEESNNSESGDDDSNEATTVSMDGYNNNELALMTEVYEDLFKNGIKAAGVDRTVRDPEHLKTLVRIGL